MTGPTRALLGACPECDADISFESAPRLGLEVICPGCDERLEVTHQSPVELERIRDDGEYQADEPDDVGEDFSK